MGIISTRRPQYKPVDVFHSKITHSFTSIDYFRTSAFGDFNCIIPSSNPAFPLRCDKHAKARKDHA